SERILLVEDDPKVRRLVREMLQRSGYTVLEARQGEQALRICEQYTGPIHLLVTDLRMPGGLGGYDLAERVAARRPELKVLFISGSMETAIAHHDALHSNAPFLQKPFTPVVLARKVREILG